MKRKKILVAACLIITVVAGTFVFAAHTSAAADWLNVLTNQPLRLTKNEVLNTPPQNASTPVTKLPTSQTSQIPASKREEVPSQATKGLFNFEPKSNAQIPDYILYDRLFRMIFSFKRKAESQAISVEKIAGLTNYFKNRANLNDEENQTLQSVAFEYIQEIAQIDAQARIIIEQTRQVYPKGVVPRNQPPPAELVNLQEQRNDLAVRYRDRLQERLGADGFAKLNQYIQQDFASRIQAVPLSEVNFDQAQ